MTESIMELRMDLILTFQEKLLASITDSAFRKQYIDPTLYSNDEVVHLNLINEIVKDEEISEIIEMILDSGECSHESIKMELMVLLRKMIERFADFEEDSDFDNDYIG